MKKVRLYRSNVVRRKPKSVNSRGKARMNLMLPADLYFWIQSYAAEKNIYVTDIVLDHFKQLKERWVAEHTAEQI